MVAAAGMNMFYGIDAFLNAKKLFESSLHEFILNMETKFPPPGPPEKAANIVIGTDSGRYIPDFLNKDGR
jgi:hypothetical protein